MKQRTTLRIQRAKMSYQATLNQYRLQNGFTRMSWITWIIMVFTVALWILTASQAALATGAQSIHAVLLSIVHNAVTLQPHDEQAISQVLIADGAKDDTLMRQGQYWRILTPIFLHVNALHVGLNMLNLLFLGVSIERLAGHLRLLLIYLVSGVVSILASFYFAPQELSVGASGALFGLVGAYSIFILMHRRAMHWQGIPALLELVVIIGFNLVLGFIIPNVDNAAHIGGLISGCLLGWWFMPFYKLSVHNTLTDARRLSVHWPLALLTIFGTLLLAIIVFHLNSLKS